MNNAGKQFWDADLTLSHSAKRYHDVDTICCPYENNPVEISIFVSCYNEEAFIHDTLSVIVQAMTIVNKSYEIIVIDDCSKDKSAEIVKNYIAEHSDINIILRSNKKNKGLAQN